MLLLKNGPGGLLYYLYQGTNLGIYPPMIFLCLGGLNRLWTATCKSKDDLAWWGSSIRYFRRILPFSNGGMTPQEAASVGIIGARDGPTALFLTTRLGNRTYYQQSP